MEQQMPTAIIHMQVKAGCEAQYKAVAWENASQSRKEPGVVRFEVYQSQSDPTRFVLHEIYKTLADQQAHRETAHFLKFKQEVAPLLAEPYVATMYTAVEK